MSWSAGLHLVGRQVLVVPDGQLVLDGRARLHAELLEIECFDHAELGLGLQALKHVFCKQVRIVGKHREVRLLHSVIVVSGCDQVDFHVGGHLDRGLLGLNEPRRGWPVGNREDVVGDGARVVLAAYRAEIDRICRGLSGRLYLEILGQDGGVIGVDRHLYAQYHRPDSELPSRPACLSWRGW